MRTGDVSDCIYSDMMPVYYNEWYVPLLEKDTFLMPESFDEGKAILNEN